MIRTQVYIPEDLHRDLMLLTKTSGENFSSLVRQGVQEVIKKRKKIKTDWMKLAGAVKGGEKEVASKIDHYLYG